MQKKPKINSFTLLWLITTMLVLSLEVTAEGAPGDVIYERTDEQTASVFPPSIFPHWKHRIHYRCDACHDSLFEMRLGGTPVTMDLIADGKTCGTCHNGTQAFRVTLSNCSRCHASLEE